MKNNNNLNALLISVIAVFSVGYITSCGDATNNSGSKIVNTPPEQPLDLIRVVIAGDDMSANVEGFGPRLQYFYDTYKIREKNHVIVHPDNKSQLKIDDAHAVIHQSDEASIKDSIVKIAETHAPKRMVVFLATHGAAAGGALCYQTHRSCSFSANSLNQVINALDKANSSKNPQYQLKQLLIIPLSCYNKTLASQYLDLLKAGTPKSFAVVMSHMMQHRPGKTNQGISASEALFSGQLKILEHSPNQFNNWANAQNRTDRIFSLKSFDQFIKLANEVMPNNLATGSAQQETHFWFAKNQSDAEIDLEAFELKLTRIKLVTQGAHPPQGQVVVGGQYHCSPQDVVRGYVGIPKLERVVSGFRDLINPTIYEKTSPQYGVAKNWPSMSLFEINFAIP